MKLRYRLFQRSNGIFFMENTVTGKQASLKTRGYAAAQRIFNAKNESHQQPAINLQIARANVHRFLDNPCVTFLFMAIGRVE